MPTTREKKPRKPRRVPKPKPLMHNDVMPIAWCDDNIESDKRWLRFGWMNFNQRDARRLARWLPKAVAWMEDAR